MGLPLGSTGGSPLIQGGLMGAFLILYKYLSLFQPPNQAHLFTFSHYDKASSIIKSFHQKCLCHSHLYKGGDGQIDLDQWTGLRTVDDRKNRGCCFTRTSLMARAGEREKMVKISMCMCPACDRKNFPQRRKAKKLGQKRNKKTRYQ